MQIVNDVSSLMGLLEEQDMTQDIDRIVLPAWPSCRLRFPFRGFL
jgi:hypothetical protein